VQHVLCGIWYVSDLIQRCNEFPVSLHTLGKQSSTRFSYSHLSSHTTAHNGTCVGKHLIWHVPLSFESSRDGDSLTRF
jgi:hypothetical protein